MMTFLTEFFHFFQRPTRIPTHLPTDQSSNHACSWSVRPGTLTGKEAMSIYIMRATTE